MPALHQTVNANATPGSEQQGIYCTAVDTLKTIRLANLKRALDGRRIAPDGRAAFLKDAFRLAGEKGGVSYWSGLLAGDRPFGEKIARKVEYVLGIREGFLDGAEVQPMTETLFQRRFSEAGLALIEAFDQLPDGEAKRDLFADLLSRIQGASHGVEPTTAPPAPAAQPKPERARDAQKPPNKRRARP
jgi:hypothetical protein